jgi:hypothetical protein
MRKILTWITVLLLSIGQLSIPQSAYATEQARAPRWHKFCDAGVTSIQVLADRVQAALAANPTGASRVEGCRATPLDFFRAHQENHADSAPTSVADLPRYYREDVELVLLPPGTRYWSACKTNSGYIGQCHLRVAGAGGERVWRHKTTHRVVMLGNCANPAGKPEVPEPALDCVSKFVYLREGDEHHIGMVGNTPLIRSACLGIKRPGEDTFDSVLLDLCRRDNCDYSGPSRALGLPVQAGLTVSYVARQAGWYELRLDANQFNGDNAVIDCIITPRGVQSQGMVTSRSEFYLGKSYLAVVSPPPSALDAVRRGATVRPVVWAGGGTLAPLAPR